MIIFLHQRAYNLYNSGLSGYVQAERDSPYEYTVAETNKYTLKAGFDSLSGATLRLLNAAETTTINKNLTYSEFTINSPNKSKAKKESKQFQPNLSYN